MRHGAAGDRDALLQAEGLHLDFQFGAIECLDEDGRRVTVSRKDHEDVKRGCGIREPLEPAVAVGDRGTRMSEDLNDRSGRRLAAPEHHPAGEGGGERGPTQGSKDRYRNTRRVHLPGI